MPEQDLVVDESIADLAPSRKLVYLVLVSADDEWLGRQELMQRTGLDHRTVRDSVADLREADVAESRSSFEDPRIKLHRVPPQ